MFNAEVTSNTSNIVRGEKGRGYTTTTVPSRDDKTGPETFYVDDRSFAVLFYYLRRKLHGTFSFTRNRFWTVCGQTPFSETLGDALWSSDMIGA